MSGSTGPPARERGAGSGIADGAWNRAEARLRRGRVTRVLGRRCMTSRTNVWGLNSAGNIYRYTGDLPG